MERITKRQYILSSHKIDSLSMTEHRIGEFYLYTDDQLNITVSKTIDGKDVFLLGNAFCTDVEGKEASKDIEGASMEQLEKATHFWTGRWTIVTECTLFNDACGLMSAFYVNRESGFYVSSSLALLSSLLDLKPDASAKSEGLTWHFSPDTIVPQISLLICTQRLVFSNNKAVGEFYHWIGDRSNLSTEEKCRIVAECLVCGIKNINLFSNRKLVLALTGGKDSRVTFSALIKSEVPFCTYTAQHANISSSDKTVPLKLARAFGIEHRYIKRKKLNHERLRDYKEFCLGNANGVDALFCAHGQFSEIPADAIVLRSGLYEAGQTYSRRLCENSLDGLRDGLVRYYSDLRDHTRQRQALERWLEYVEENAIEYIDLRDRLYVEQRVGGWVSAIEQSLDMNDFVSIQIANCAEIMSVLLSCTEEERKKLSLSYDTIRLLAPKALEFDVNKVTFSDKFTRLKQIAKNPIGKAKNFLNKKRK